MKLNVIRHGETEENVKKELMGHRHGKLTEKGLLQAKQNAELLKNINFDFIYTSDLQRCIDTVKEIKKYHPDTPLIATKELRELNFGVLQGCKRTEIDWEKELGEDQFKGRPQDGESIYDLRQRIQAFIDYLLKKHFGESILLVTHSGVIRQLISKIAKIPSEEVFKNIPIQHTMIFEFEIQSNGEGKWLNQYVKKN